MPALAGTQQRIGFTTMRHSESYRSLSKPLIFGGADRDRTGGLLVANQALSQLSYSPIRSFKSHVSRCEPARANRAADSKLENQKLET